MKNVVTIVGARPQFIKAAPVGMALGKISGIKHTLIHTGQHFDANMSDIFFNELQIQPPDFNLGINGKTHGVLTGRILEALDTILPDLNPDMVIIYGDTDTTLAGCLSAVKMHIPVSHIEAGLRSFNRRMPEEINRVMADHASSLLFCPTELAVKNLKNEGLTSNVHLVGDVMFDMCLIASKKAAKSSRILSDLNLTEKRYYLATIHRAENTDTRENLQKVISYLLEASSDKPLIIPLHPRTRNAVKKFGLSLDGLRTIDPVGYFDMLQLLKNADMVFTDSGGLQKEAFFMKTPCITMRDETEWIETIESGFNKLWGEKKFKTRTETTPYGNGDAADKIVEIISGL